MTWVKYRQGGKIEREKKRDIYRRMEERNEG